MAFVVLLAVAAAGCGGGGKSAATTTITTTVATNPTGTVSVTTHGRFHYPQVVIDNFMKSCMGGNEKKRSYCGCTLDKLSNTVSVQDFARVGLAHGKLPPRIKRSISRAAVACARKL